MSRKKNKEEYVFMVIRKKDYQLLMKKLESENKAKGKGKIRVRNRNSKSFETYLDKLTKKIEDGH